MDELLDDGPFFHGTIADPEAGELLTAGRRSNYRPEIVMNHVYFTALVEGAGLAAENDPNVTDKKFPGNPTRSYRSRAPLRIVGETSEWTRLTPEQLQMWRERLSVLLSVEGAEILN